MYSSADFARRRDGGLSGEAAGAPMSARRFMGPPGPHIINAAAKAEEALGVRFPVPLRELLLQCLVFGPVSGDQVRRAAADAVRRGGVLERADHFRMRAQSEVVVAGEVGERAPIDRRARALGRGPAVEGTWLEVHL